MRRAVIIMALWGYYHPRLSLTGIIPPILRAAQSDLSHPAPMWLHQQGGHHESHAEIKSNDTLAAKIIRIKLFPNKQLKIIARQKTKLVCFAEIWKTDATANETASTLQNAEKRASKTPKFAFYSSDLLLEDYRSHTGHFHPIFPPLWLFSSVIICSLKRCHIHTSQKYL